MGMGKPAVQMTEVMLDKKCKRCAAEFVTTNRRRKYCDACSAHRKFSGK